ncbi:hypothetical protein LSAT2_016736 [Lamellibrachia satsuma]|nr:hypothetical protein LSAT2_016736 [Lamellibrachia satsuma]
MMSLTLTSTAMFNAVVILLIIAFGTGIEALQCYNCRGITHYDQNQCFEPNKQKTVIQECSSGQVCEKKIHRIDLWQEVIERGCSFNCDNRDYIWTPDFRVHCCSDDNLCNGVPRTTSLSLGGVVGAAVVSLLVALL